MEYWARARFVVEVSRLMICQIANWLCVSSDPLHGARRPAWALVLVHLLLATALSEGQTTNPSPSAPAPGANELPLPTTARQLRDLARREAARRYPIHLQAVVTYFDPAQQNLFVHDGTGGLWVLRTFRQTNFHTGDLLEINGLSEAWNGPGLTAKSIKVLGTAPLPAAHWTTFDRLASGDEDCEWLKIRGVIRSMAYRFELLKIDLAVGKDHVPLYLPGYGERPLPTNLIGAAVEAQGVCSMKFNTNGQIYGFWYYVPNTNFIEVLRPAPEDPFAGDTRPVREFRQWRRIGPDDLIKVKGVVTWASDDQRIFLRDETGSLQVRLQQRWLRDDPAGRYLDPPAVEPARPGDVVEAVGYPSLGEFGFVLVDARYRGVASAPPPPPRPMNLGDALEPKFDGELVSVEARSLDREPRRSAQPNEKVLVFQAEDTTFEVLLPAAAASRLRLVKDSLVRLTGVNVIQANQWLKGHSFQLLLRGPEDLTVLQTPPRWTWLDAAKFGAGASLVLFAGFAWVLALRRQVQVQTARVSERTSELRAANEDLKKEIAVRERAEAGVRRAEAEVRAALEKERELGELKTNFVNVVSHEFRTPLGVILSSSEILASYLDGLQPAERAEHLADIKACACHMTSLMEDVLVLGRVEAGKMQFRPAPLDVPNFCRHLIDEVLSATNRQCPIQFTEEGADGPARGDEGLLRHILQNLLSNAVKYSSPGKTVGLAVRRDGPDAIFTVRDEGIGIPAEDLKRVFTAFHRGRNVGPLPGSGLGLVIVKRCVELHAGSIHLDSTEGAETRVTVRVPLFVPPGQTELIARRIPNLNPLCS